MLLSLVYGKYRFISCIPNVGAINLEVNGKHDNGVMVLRLRAELRLCVVSPDTLTEALTHLNNN